MMNLALIVKRSNSKYNLTFSNRRVNGRTYVLMIDANERVSDSVSERIPSYNSYKIWIKTFKFMSIKRNVYKI